MTADCDDKNWSREHGQEDAEEGVSDYRCSPAVSPENQDEQRSTAEYDASCEGSPGFPEGPESRLACESGAGKEKIPLTSDELDSLRIMIREYKDHRMDFSVLPRRPRFKHPRVNSGITCNAEIRRRAVEKAKNDPDGTGGSLSSLIELLLWKFLGCPSDVVERFPK